MAKKKKSPRDSGPLVSDEAASSWPTRLQLSAWYVFMQLQEAPLADVTPELIHDWLENAMSADAVILHRQLFKEFEDFRQQFVPADAADAKDIKSRLTTREVCVLKLIMEADTNKQIAEKLGIGVETVKEHVQNILRKMGARDRTQAAVWAVRNGVEYL